MMTEELLQKLQMQIRTVLQQQNQLKRANHELGSQLTRLLEEKHFLLDRQQKAVLQIETLVSKLKELETLS